MELALIVLLALLLGVALFALWRQSRRLEEVSERLDEFRALAFLPDRVQALARVVEAADLGSLHERLDRFGEGLSRVEDLAAALPETGTVSGTRLQSVRARTLRFLRDEGYHSVRILSEDSELEADPAEVRVQALRRGTVVRGRVVVAGDEVAEIRLDPHYAAFP
ncbi:MAG: hypothetical protein O3A20_03615 [Planctomycetota bacterium]|nr:hypothetical protein [Planctomycetota bacterium]